MPNHLVTNLFENPNHDTTDQLSGMHDMIQKQAEENGWIIVSETRDHDPQQIINATQAYRKHQQAKPVTKNANNEMSD